MVYALVSQLIDQAGVGESAITLYDAILWMGDPIYTRINADYPGVNFVDHYGGSGRIQVQYDPAVSLYAGDPSIVPDSGDIHFPTCVTEAKYLVNMALMKPHVLAGMTLCAKNHFGSVWHPNYDRMEGWDPGLFHQGIAAFDWEEPGYQAWPGRLMGTYNPLVDLMGHQELGGKTLLYLIEALYTTEVHQGGEPVKWSTVPFSDDWASSLFVSQDGVAIDSVGLDFLRSEPITSDNIRGTLDNYLHEAALANDPCSTIFYDPEDDGTRLSSLGTHEHWNNPFNKQYSRNLGSGNGIELVSSFSRPVPFSARKIIGDNFVGAHSVYPADLDGDGDHDVLGAAVEDDEITWWENVNGDAETWTRHVIDDTFDGSVTVYAADMDGDDDIDVLGAAHLDDEITWWENVNGDGSVWSKHIVDTMFDRAGYVYAADIDGDDDMDILGAAGDDDDITWWENLNGDGLTWDEHTIDANFDGAWGVYAADVDGDNDLDVLGAATEAADITWWENLNGNGLSWDEHLVDGDYTWSHGVYASDVDGDNDIDILGASVDDKEVTWWENINGDGLTWTEHIVDDDAYGAVTVQTADMDDDGDLDIIGAVYYNNDVIWWENIYGDGTVWNKHVVDGEFGNSHGAFADDIDGDGDLDILGSAVGDAQMAWWENQSKNIIPGDFEPDGDVDADDLVVMAEDWLETGVTSFRDYFTRGFQTATVANMNLPQTSSPPVIDGMLMQAEWQGALTFEINFPDIKTPPKQGGTWANTLGRDPSSAEFSATWYFMWDVDNLYVAVSVNDNTPYHTSDPAGPYYTKDVAQLCLSLFDCGDGTWQPEGSSGTCAALYDIVPDTQGGTGARFSQYNYDYGGRRIDTEIPGAQVKGNWWNDGWIVELSIPWQQVDFYDHNYVPSINDVHGINLLYVNKDAAGLTMGVYAMGGMPPWDSMSNWPDVQLVETNSQSSLWLWHTGSTMYQPLNSSADLYPEPYPNDRVNLKDFVIFSQNWLYGVQP